MQINDCRFGFCCIALPDGPYQGSNFKTTTLKSCSSLDPDVAVKKLTSIYRHNLAEYAKVIQYCIGRGIFVYRISSSMFPLADHKDFKHVFEGFSLDESWNTAKQATARYLSLGGKLSTHPSQFVSITSRDENIIKSSIENLKHHADFMDLLGLPQTHQAHINIHLSNGSKCPVESKRIVEDIWYKIPANVRSRLTFENEDKGCWTPSVILQHFKDFNIPVVFDAHHFRVNPDKMFSLEEAFNECRRSWDRVGETQVTHLSQGKASASDRSHSDFVDNSAIPAIFLNNKNFCELEAKQKNIALFKL